MGVITLALVLLSGCKSMPSQPTQAEAPATQRSPMLQVPGDTDRYFYAMGEAETVELAKNRALSDIAARISVSVSGSTYNEVSITRNNDQQETSERLDSSVSAIAKTIEFAGVTVENTQTVGDLRYVLVKVDRHVLFNSYRERLDQKRANLDKESSIFKQSDPFTQLKLSFRIQQLIKESEEMLTVLNAMRPGFSDQTYRQSHTENQAMIRDAKASAVFSIQADSNSKALETLIKRYLSEANIKMSPRNGNVNLYLTTDAEEKKYKTTSVKLAKMKIVSRTSTLKVKNDRGVTISNNVVKTRAASSLSLDDAIQQTKQYEELIEKQGILAFISGN